MRPVGVTKKGNKGQKLSCVKLAICPDHPRRHRLLKFCMWFRVRKAVIYFKFHENRSRGFEAVGGRKSPSPIDKAHCLYNSLYYRTSRDSGTFSWLAGWFVHAHKFWGALEVEKYRTALEVYSNCTIISSKPLKSINVLIAFKQNSEDNSDLIR